MRNAERMKGRKEVKEDGDELRNEGRRLSERVGRRLSRRGMRD